MNRKEIAFALYSIINSFPFNNKVKGNLQIENKGSILINCKVIGYGKENRIVFQTGGVFRNCEFIIHGNNNVIIFENDCRANYGSFYIEDDNNLISTGKETNYAGSIHIACTEGTSITVGDHCLFSSDIVIRSGDSHSILNMQGERINHAENVMIEDHVWVGYGVKINKGATIHNDSVVGTGSIVTRTSPLKSNAIIAGVPAKVVRRNITWDSTRI